jgi:thiamine biosynthesis lipoprotein
MKYQKSQFLMWTDINITIVSNKNPIKDIYDSFGIFYSLEKEFSRFLEKSDLNILNNSKKLEVSNRFIEVLKLTQKVYLDTEKYFNPLINLRNIWYGTTFKKWIFKKEEIKQNLDLKKILVVWNFVTLTESHNLDLGWIVKGYWVDLVSSFLKEKGYENFIINAWWDIYLSWNNASGNTPVVSIDNPFNEKEIFATLDIKNKSLSTSGIYKRKWNIDWEDFHHILNPEQNNNNNEIISISLIADKCYIADSYATACIAMWIEKSLMFLQKQNIDWIIIWSDWSIYTTKWMSVYNLNII